MNAEETLYADLKKVEQLFRCYYKVLRIYALRFVNDLNVAENIVQDVFFEIWVKRDSIDFDGEVKSYLFRSVYNKCMNHLQSFSYTRRISLEDVTEEEVRKKVSGFPYGEQENLLMLEELETEIETIINSLPPQCKTVFQLSRVSNLKNKEISEKLGISIKTVEKHMSKALTELRMRLKGKELLLILYLFQF